MKAVKAIAWIGIMHVSLIAAPFAAGAQQTGHWVAAWGAAPHALIQFPGTPPPPGFENQTLRMIVRPTIGGERLRIQLSNVFGTSGLKIGAAHVALLENSSKIVAGSDRTLAFGAQPAVVIPPGALIVSDAVDLKVPALTEIAISLFLPEPASISTTHLVGQHETYVSGPGDFTGSPEIAAVKTVHSWYWLAGVEIWSSERTTALVTLGDSITDGFGSTAGQYRDWPDQLASRLASSKGESLAVINEGIGGNRILHDGMGVNALARLDRDVLAQAGVTQMILLEGVNDVGWPHMKPPKGMDPEIIKRMNVAAQDVTATDLIVAMKQIIERAHEHGIRIYGATILPYEGADYYSEPGESSREAVNQWIRTSGAFDGVIDFDLATRDPVNPKHMRDDLQIGDHLHPNDNGYKIMADAIDLALLRARSN